MRAVWRAVCVLTAADEFARIGRSLWHWLVAPERAPSDAAALFNEDALPPPRREYP